MQCVHRDILGPLPFQMGASKSGSRGGIIPGSEQAANVNDTTTAAVLMLPIIMAHKPKAVQTSFKKKNEGVQIKPYVNNMQGKSGPVKQVRGAILW